MPNKMYDNLSRVRIGCVKCAIITNAKFVKLLEFTFERNRRDGFKMHRQPIQTLVNNVRYRFVKFGKIVFCLGRKLEAIHYSSSPNRAATSSAL